MIFLVSPKEVFMVLPASMLSFFLIVIVMVIAVSIPTSIAIHSIILFDTIYYIERKTVCE